MNTVQWLEASRCASIPQMTLSPHIYFKITVTREESFHPFGHIKTKVFHKCQLNNINAAFPMIKLITSGDINITLLTIYPKPRKTLKTV